MTPESRCPSCQAELPANGVLCASCGFYPTLGRKFESSVVVKPAGETAEFQTRLSERLAEGIYRYGLTVAIGLAAALLIPDMIFPVLAIVIVIVVLKRFGLADDCADNGSSGEPDGGHGGGWFSWGDGGDAGDAGGDGGDGD